MAFLRKLGNSVQSRIPIFQWTGSYKTTDLPGDITAGVIVAILLIPQSMAYALLAGLPPQVGLYASILPLVAYAIFGTGRAVSVAPVAIDSLIVATGVGMLATQGTQNYLELAILLAFMVGIIHLIMGAIRMGVLVNFISSSVIAGFTNAAALIIGFSQLKHILGFDIPRSKYLHETLIYAAEHVHATNLFTLALGGGGILAILFVKNFIDDYLKKTDINQRLRITITRSAPLVVILAGTLTVWLFSMHETSGVAIVGSIPAGFPAFSLPVLDFSQMKALTPTAFTIALVAFLENISVAKSLASKRREKIDVNQELTAIGVANITSAFSGGYSVTGGFSRSAVNFSAGANSGLASIFTAGLIFITTLFLTPWFYFLPKAILGSIIMVAVFGLIDFKTLVWEWHYDKLDAVVFVITFLAVLTTGIQLGILIGAGIAILLFLWRTARPHIAEVGRIEGSEHFRNVLRHEVSTCPHVLAIRIDESLYFGNISYLEDEIIRRISDNPEVENLLLLGSGINFIDANSLKVLEKLKADLREAGVTLCLSDIKGPVMDKLKRTGFLDDLGDDRVFLSSHQAMKALQCV